MRYKLKPLILEAVQFKDDIVSITEITRLSDADVSVDYSQDPPIVLLQGSNQILTAREGDYIVKGVAGEIYVLPERVFIQVFDPIE